MSISGVENNAAVKKERERERKKGMVKTVDDYTIWHSLFL